MTSRRRLFDDLIDLPWWCLLCLSAASFLALRYIPPQLNTSNHLGEALKNVAAEMAAVPAAGLAALAIVSLIRRYRRQRLLSSQDSLSSIQSLPWHEFEYLIGEAYRQQGYQVIENAQAGADDGIDLELRRGQQWVLVQCKQWKSKTSVKAIREFQGVLSTRPGAQGLFVCSGGFTQPAREFATEARIELIDANGLARLIGVGREKPPVSASPTPAPSNLCPTCNAAMVGRTARQGALAGSRFLGCSRFPACRGTRPLP